MFINFNRKKLALSILTLILLFVFSLGAFAVQDEECCLYKEKPECPPRYSSFNPSKNVYSPGETVHLTLSGLIEEYVIEEIKIEKNIGIDEGVVYTEVIDQPISLDTTEWSWSWNQHNNDGEQVVTGRYFALLETECCGIFRTNFKIIYQPRPRCSCNCCGSWSTRLDTGCSRYETGEKVMVNYSNCRGCDVIFERLVVEKSDRCCGGGEVVYSQDFSGGFDPGRNWSWAWDQRSMNNNFVEPGRYTVSIETECCGEIETSFTVYESRDCCRSSCGLTSCSSSRCRSSCCGSGFGLLFFGSCNTCNTSCNTCNTCN